LIRDHPRESAVNPPKTALISGISVHQLWGLAFPITAMTAISAIT
jgi:hypothetical protein